MKNEEAKDIYNEFKSLEDTVNDLTERIEQLEKDKKEIYCFINDVKSNYKRENLEDQYNIYDRDFI